MNEPQDSASRVALKVLFVVGVLSVVFEVVVLIVLVVRLAGGDVDNVPGTLLRMAFLVFVVVFASRFLRQHTHWIRAEAR